MCAHQEIRHGLVQDPENKEKDMRETTREKMNDTGKAAADVVESGYDMTKTGLKEAYDSMAKKCGEAKSCVLEKAEEANEYLTQKVHDIKSN
ncbi:hypothetical protein Aduo_005971 [Ancylostoma duodenale]